MTVAVQGQADFIRKRLIVFQEEDAMHRICGQRLKPSLQENADRLAVQLKLDQNRMIPGLPPAILTIKPLKHAFDVKFAAF